VAGRRISGGDDEGGDLGRGEQLDRDAVGVAQPGALAVGQRVRRRGLDAQAARPFEQRLEVFRIDAEADVFEPLGATAGMHRRPAVRIAKGMQREAAGGISRTSSRTR
jgi:hypothetical protein